MAYMPKPRTWTDEELRVAVIDSTSIAGVLRTLGLSPVGGSYRTIRHHVERLNLDLSHFTGSGWNRGNSGSSNSRSFDEVLIQNSPVVNHESLKRRLMQSGMLIARCRKCGLVDWLAKPIVLHLDHINGDSHDYRIENLRLLCPNCHSQTSTYCRRKSMLT